MRAPPLLVPVPLLILFAAGPLGARDATAAPAAAAAHRRAPVAPRASARPPSSAGKLRPRARVPAAKIDRPTASHPIAELVPAGATGGTTAAGSSAPAPDGGVLATASGDPEAAGGAPRGPALPADPLPVARLAMDQLARNLQHVQRIRAKGAKDTFTADCLAEKVAEARVGVQLGDEEMARLHAGIASGDADEQAYALHRLKMLVDRASTVLDGARICASQDPGGITATKVEVEISPAVPQGDPTAPPTPFHPVERPPAQ